MFYALVKKFLIESSIMTAVYVTMPGGRVVLVGIGPTEVKVPTVIASTRYLFRKSPYFKM